MNWRRHTKSDDLVQSFSEFNWLDGVKSVWKPTHCGIEIKRGIVWEIIEKSTEVFCSSVTGLYRFCILLMQCVIFRILVLNLQYIYRWVLWIPVSGFWSLSGYWVSDQILLVFKTYVDHPMFMRHVSIFFENQCNEKHRNISKENIEGKKKLTFDVIYHCPVNKG